MNVDSDANNAEAVLERLAQHHLLSPHSALSIGHNKDATSSSPTGSSSPSPVSVSSFSSHSKVTSSTNGATGNGKANTLGSPSSSRSRPSKNAFNLDLAQLYSSLSNFSGELAANSLLSSFNTGQQRMLMLQALASANLASASSNNNNNNNNNNNSSSRSKSSSSDGSNNGSPLSGLVTTGGKASHTKPRSADSPGSGSTNSTSCSREKVFVCNICNRSFGYKHVLQNHERTHTGEKPFECRECHKRFTRDHHLKTHMRLHTGEKPYHCTHCDRQFVQVANLRRHLRVHTGERPYACELCESKFSDSNQLKAHMLIHKGEKPFSCGMCHGRFRRRHHLNHHKCPKDEANMGRPRRGRRPKAYDQMSSPGSYSGSRPGSADHLLAMAHLPLTLTATAAVTTSSTANNFVHHASKPPATHLLANSLMQLPFPHLSQSTPSPTGMQAHHLPPHRLPSEARHFMHRPDSPPKLSRRKPRHTTRIVKHERDDNDEHENDEHSLSEYRRRLANGQDDQPLNLSLSPRIEAVNLAIANSIRAYNACSRSTAPAAADSADNALDLSRSRSDAESEPEPIEEEDDDDETEEMLVKEDDGEEEGEHGDDDMGETGEQTARNSKPSNGATVSSQRNTESEDDELELSSVKRESFSSRMFPSMHIKHNNNNNHHESRHGASNKSLDNLLLQAQLKKHFEDKKSLLGLDATGLSGLDYISALASLRASAMAASSTTPSNGNPTTVSDKSE